MRWDPFADMNRFSSVFGNAGAMMPMDLYETSGTFVARFDLPGIDPDSIELTVENQMLTVTVERSREDTEDANWLVRERPAGRHSRQLRLGSHVDGGGIEAHYDNGVLTVTIPVREEAKPHRVKIQAGDREPALTS